ncbi:uncharacterized protein LOC135341711 [Halichondria panicea]|uniref:uncharacterized protein LOC135341711 n=1 Tax=Halichondria panicea TaxID=6063 RepID=UPI00312B9ABE
MKLPRRTVFTLVLLSITLYQCAQSLSIRQNARLQQKTVTTCSGAGYKDGCCISGNTNCFIAKGSCYCDVTCHDFGDCCEDIEAIGCLAPGTTTTASPTTTAVSPTTTASPTTPTTTDNQLGCTCATTAGVTCSDANLSPGCCVCTNSDQAECYVPGGRCHCDAQCFFFGDCCSDVPSSPQCFKKDKWRFTKK